MPLEPIFQDIQLSQKRNNLKEHVKVECKTDLPKDGVSKILNVTARSVVTSSEVLDDRINYEGRATFLFVTKRTMRKFPKLSVVASLRALLKPKTKAIARRLFFLAWKKPKPTFRAGVCALVVTLR